MTRIPLKEMFAASGTRRRRVAIGALTPTGAQSRPLLAAYTAILRIWVSAINDRIVPAYGASLSTMVRDSVDGVNAEIDRTAEDVVRAILTFRFSTEEWAKNVNKWHLTRFVNQLKYSTNVDLKTLMVAADPAITETIADVVARNASLVRNVSDEIRAKIADSVFRGLQSRTPVRDVAKEIAKTTGLARDRSLRIASDQTVKLAAALDKERQLQVGMNSFEWVHSDKLNFRPEHRARDGKTYKWDSDVGRNDPPGFLPFCGCKARGVLDLDDDE